MTTPIATSDLGADLAPEPPAVLPDAATLARWANEFFSAAPALPAAQLPRAAPMPLSKPTGAPAPSNVGSFDNVMASIGVINAGVSAFTRLSAADLTHPVLPFVPTSLETIRPLEHGGVAPSTSAAPSFYFLEMPGTLQRARATSSFRCRNDTP